MTADVSLFDPGDVVTMLPTVLPQPTPITALTRAGVNAWPPEMTVERVRPLGAGQFALQFDGIPGQWLSTAFRLVEKRTPAKCEIVGTPPPRRAIDGVRLYSHGEILREAGAVLTTVDFDALMTRLEAL